MRRTLAGVPIELAGDWPAPLVAGLTVASIEESVSAGGAQADADPPIRITCCSQEAPEASLAGGRPLLLKRPLGVVGGLEAPRYWLRAQGVSALGDLGLASSSLFLGDESRDRDRAAQSLLALTLMLQLAARGFYYLHAAVVVDPAGRGWVLIGGGGAGKSTTAYALVRRGWRYLSDDRVLLRVDGGRVHAHSLGDRFCLATSLTATFAELELGAPRHDGSGKAEVPMARLFPGAHCDHAVPSRLVMLLRDTGGGGAPRSTTSAPVVTRTAYVKAMADDNPLLRVSHPQLQIATLAALVGQCEVGTVDVGAELLADPDGCLERAVRHA